MTLKFVYSHSYDFFVENATFLHRIAEKDIIFSFESTMGTVNRFGGILLLYENNFTKTTYRPIFIKI